MRSPGEHADGIVQGIDAGLFQNEHYEDVPPLADVDAILEIKIAKGEIDIREAEEIREIFITHEPDGTPKTD